MQVNKYFINLGKARKKILFKVLNQLCLELLFLLLSSLFIVTSMESIDKNSTVTQHCTYIPFGNEYIIF